MSDAPIRQEIQQVIRSAYGRKACVFEKHRQGLSHDVFALAAGEGEQATIFKLYSKDTAIERIRSEVETCQALSRRNFTLAPEVLCTTQNLAIVECAARSGVLFSRLPGQVRYTLCTVPELCTEIEELGRVLALLHRELREISRSFVFSPFDSLSVIDTVGAVLGKDKRELMLNALRGLSQTFGAVRKDALVWHPIHGDFHPQNVLWERATISGVVDFEYSAHAPRAFDLAMALSNLLSGSEANLRRVGEVTGQFLQAYEEELDNSLNRTEREALPALLLFSFALNIQWALSHKQRPDVSEYLAQSINALARTAETGNGIFN
jgi:Ser/Thr protein kinase RdoA (MazF antagonist)